MRPRGTNMKLTASAALLATTILCLASVRPAAAASTPFFFSTGNPDGLIATATRPGTGAEIESADDFVLSTGTSITSATFTGLIPVSVALSDV